MIRARGSEGLLVTRLSNQDLATSPASQLQADTSIVQISRIVSKHWVLITTTIQGGTRTVTLIEQSNHYLDIYGRHVRMLDSFVSATCCVFAGTSAFVLALKTLTLTKQPRVATTLLSVGSRDDPQVVTSGALPEAAALTLDKTKLNAPALVQDPETAGKLTFRAMPAGRNGLPELTRAVVSVVESDAYTPL